MATQENQSQDEACQPRIVAVEAVEEVMGLCAGTEEPCATDGDCSEGILCEGYVAAVEGVAGVDADTLACTCESPLGEIREATQTCNEEGTGYNDCNCPCSTEMARWITTYGREGRWVTDVSPFLAFFKDGGSTSCGCNRAIGMTLISSFDCRTGMTDLHLRPCVISTAVRASTRTTTSTVSPSYLSPSPGLSGYSLWRILRATVGAPRSRIVPSFATTPITSRSMGQSL